MKQRISPVTAIVVLIIALGICGAAYIGVSNSQTPPPPPPGSAKTIDESTDSKDLGGMRKKGTAPAKKAGDRTAAPAEPKKGD